MLWVPAVRLVVLNVAWPEPFMVPVPSTAPPSLNVTVPVGTATGELTTAVKVIVWPAPEGLSDELTLVELDALLTVCVTGAEVLVKKLPLPA